jgi:hypothetical protein
LVLSVFLLGTAGVLSAAGQPRDRTSKVQLKNVVSTSIEATPSAINFVNVPIGESSSQLVTVTNVGEATLQIQQISVSNADFGISGVMLPVVVAHGTTESFTIAYRAKSEGSANGQIRIVTNTGDLVISVKASAAGQHPELTATDARMDFEDVAVGNIGRKQVTLKNSGNCALSIDRMAVSGADFSTSGAGAVNLNPGQAINLEINFEPKGTGERAGSLVVTSLAGQALLQIPLQGTGAISSNTAVHLNWEESPVSVAGYVVYRAGEPSGPYTRISGSAVSAAEFIDTGLAAGHTYYYVVSSLGVDEVETEYSQPIMATVPVA